MPRLSISDTGTGIPTAVLGKVFEPFFTTKEVGKGTGLGLSTVYGIVKQSGGFIFADSTVGEGTRFVIYLPVHRVEEEARPRRLAKAKPQENELWGTGTILLVEDEAMVRTVAERALARHGYKVLTANNGEEALERLEECGDEVALLISDVVMPVMDGPTMVREARKTAPRPADPVHVGLCRGAIAQVDRHRQRRLPAQAVQRARTGRSGAARPGRR